SNRHAPSPDPRKHSRATLQSRQDIGWHGEEAERTLAGNRNLKRHRVRELESPVAEKPRAFALLRAADDVNRADDAAATGLHGRQLGRFAGPMALQYLHGRAMHLVEDVAVNPRLARVHVDRPAKAGRPAAILNVLASVENEPPPRRADAESLHARTSGKAWCSMSSSRWPADFLPTRKADIGSSLSFGSPVRQVN